MSYSIDTRTLEPSDIFIPIKGSRFDGHNYIQDALRKGAKKILDIDIGEYSKYIRKEKLKATIVGITGSSGKTTVKDLLTHILKSSFKVHKTTANNNNEIGLPLTILNAPEDTEIIVAEMAMRKRGDLEYLANLAKPNISLITNIGSAHIGFLKTRKNIALAKSEIFKFKKISGQKHITFLNSNIDYFSLLKDKATNNNIEVYTFTETNILTQNSSLAKQTALYFNIPEKIINERIASFQSNSPHRQKTIPFQNTLIIDDSYNANPESMSFAIEKACTDYPNKSIIVILGEMKELGEKEKYYHHKLIKQVLKNSRISNGFFIGTAYKYYEKFVKNTGKCYYFDNQSSIATRLKSMDFNNKILLIKGSRSMELEKVVQLLSDVN